ncbi:MAG: DUF5698 domain-containing protein [Anaerolineaceae bacterium]|nr:DUF5698 domain-containing protein [Anaerolineaceae bacterium]
MISFPATPSAWLIVLAIFIIRVISIAMDMLRFLLALRGKSTIAWILGFLETVMFVYSMGWVLSDTSKVLNVVAYCAGFATGNSLGMWLEKKLAIGFSHITIISKLMDMRLAEAIRQQDYAVTEISAHGKDGDVAMLNLTVRRKDLKRIQNLAKEMDPEAFITSEDISPLASGYWGTGTFRN